MPVRVKRLENAKHIFSHVEWHMTGYEIVVDEQEQHMRGAGREKGEEDIIFADIQELKEYYPMPSAFEAYCPV